MEIRDPSAWLRVGPTVRTSYTSAPARRWPRSLLPAPKFQNLFIIYEELHPELRAGMCPPHQGQVSFGQTWLWHLPTLQTKVSLQVRRCHMCPVMASRALCMQRSFQKDMLSGPETAGYPPVPSAAWRWFYSRQPSARRRRGAAPGACWLQREMLPHAWDSRGAATDALPRAALAPPSAPAYLLPCP